MLRMIAYLLMTILVVTVLRTVIGVVMKGLSGAFSSPDNTPAQRQSAEVPAAGELRKDPVCGVYVPTTTAFKRTTKGETVYYCSEACQKKAG
jgi:hypothetical protein